MALRGCQLIKKIKPPRRLGGRQLAAIFVLHGHFSGPIPCKNMFLIWPTCNVTKTMIPTQNFQMINFETRGGQWKTKPPIPQFEWGRLLEHSFLEHFCIDQFSVVQGKFYMQRFSNTSFGRTLLGSNFGASCSNKLFVGTLRSSRWGSPPPVFK